jgi:hypothetical protein
MSRYRWMPVHQREVSPRVTDQTDAYELHLILC